MLFTFRKSGTTEGNWQHNYLIDAYDFSFDFYLSKVVNFDLPRLHQILRRLYADLILCYKIIHGLTVLHSEKFFTVTANHVTRGHSYKMFLPESRINCRQHFFEVHIVKVWNSLPADVVCANSVSVFVHKLKSVDFSQFLIGKD